MSPEPAYVDDPFHVDGRGRIALAGPDEHVRDMIRQVLFTSPGERVNRPEFGCGLLQMTFMPNHDAFAAATQFLVHASLDRWLGDVIRVEDVRVRAEGEVLRVEVDYVRRLDGRARRDVFETAGGGIA